MIDLALCHNTIKQVGITSKTDGPFLLDFAWNIVLEIKYTINCKFLIKK